MDKKLVKAINNQITKEYYSSYLYLAMAAYFEAANLPGLALWMKKQSQEETSHGNKLFEYLGERGERVELAAIDKPPSDFKSVKDVFKQTLDHEKKVTASINSLYSLATKVNDTAAQIFLQWFITEQVEEEKNATDILAKLDLIKDSSMGLIMLDKELGSR